MVATRPVTAEGGKRAAASEVGQRDSEVPSSGHQESSHSLRVQKFQPKRTLQLMVVNCICQLGWDEACPDNWVKHHFGVCLLRMSLDKISF